MFKYVITTVLLSVVTGFGITNEAEFIQQELLTPEFYDAIKEIQVHDIVEGTVVSKSRDTNEVKQVCDLTRAFVTNLVRAFEPKDFQPKDFPGIKLVDNGADGAVFEMLVRRMADDKRKHFGTSFVLAASTASSGGQMEAVHVAYFRALRVGIMKELDDKGVAEWHKKEILNNLKMLEFLLRHTFKEIDGLDLDEGDLAADMAGLHLYQTLSVLHLLSRDTFEPQAGEGYK